MITTQKHTLKTLPEILYSVTPRSPNVEGMREPERDRERKLLLVQVLKFNCLTSYKAGVYLCILYSAQD